MNWPLIRTLITKHEGFRCSVYPDSRGVQTIGIGFNLEDPSAEQTCQVHGLDRQALLNGTATLTLAEAQTIRDDYILSARFSALKLIPGFDALPDNAQAVVIDMIYEMGPQRFSGFHDTIAALNAQPPDFHATASQMKQSDWYGEVPTRAQEDCMLMAAAAMNSRIGFGS